MPKSVISNVMDVLYLFLYVAKLSHLCINAENVM